MENKFTKQKLLTRSESFAKLASKMKEAQLGDGTASPEMTKDVIEEVVGVIMDEAETLKELADAVPAEENMGSPMEEQQEESPLPDDESEIPPREGTEQNLREIEGEDDERKQFGRKASQEIASLKKKIENMEIASAKEKLATQYASLWPAGKQSTAKFASFMKSKDSIPILQARLEEAKNLMGTANVKSNQKQASMQDWSLYENFDSNQRIASSGDANDKFDISNMVSMKV